MKLLLLYFLCVTLSFSESNIFVNNEHSFSVQKASKKQTFLYHDQIQQIHPKALIGIIDESKEFYSFLLINPSKGLTLQEFSRKIVDQIEISNIKLNNFKDYDHQGLKAVSFNLSGFKNSHHIDYEVNLIERNDTIIQLYSVLIGQNINQLKFSSLKPQLLLHNKKNRHPQKLTTSKDWLIANNKYYNQSNGFFLDLDIENYTKVECSQGVICLDNPIDQKSLMIQAYPYTSNMVKQFLNFFDSEFKTQEFLTNNASNKIFLVKHKKQKSFYHLFSKAKDQNKVLMVFKSDSYLDHKTFEDISNKKFGWIKGKGLHQLDLVLSNKDIKTLVQDRFQNFYKNQYRNFKAGIEINFPKKDKIKFELTKKLPQYLLSEFYINNLSKNYTLETQIQKHDSTKSELEIHKHILKRLSKGNSSKIITSEYLGLYHSKINLNGSPYYVLTRRHYNSLFYGIFKGSAKSLHELLSHFHFLELKEVQISKNTYKNHKYQFSFTKQNYLVQELPSNQSDLLQVEIKNKYQTSILYVGPKDRFTKESIVKIHSDDHKIFGLNELTSAKKSYLSYPYDYDQYTVSYPNENLRLVQQTFVRGNLIFSSVTTGNDNILDESFIHHHNLNLNNTFTR